MNHYDAELWAEDKGIEDGVMRVWEPPLRGDAGLTAIYAQNWWLAFEMDVIAEEFPNG